MDGGLFVIRLVVGLLLAGHGAQKLLRWFGGHGVKGTGGFLDSLGYRPGQAWAVVVGILEFVGGLLFALGLFSPLGSLGIGVVMLTAIAKVHWPKIWAAEGGIELPVTNLAVVVGVSLTGPGAISFDHALGTALPGATIVAGWVVVVLGWLVGLTYAATRAKEPSKTPSH